jgi:hypothetical protein
MPNEAETSKPVAKTKAQIEAEFKRRHKYGFEQLSEIKDVKDVRAIRLRAAKKELRPVKKDSTDTKPSK